MILGVHQFAETHTLEEPKSWRPEAAARRRQHSASRLARLGLLSTMVTLAHRLYNRHTLQHSHCATTHQATQGSLYKEARNTHNRKKHTHNCTQVVMARSPTSTNRHTYAVHPAALVTGPASCPLCLVPMQTHGKIIDVNTWFRNGLPELYYSSMHLILQIL